MRIFPLILALVATIVASPLNSTSLSDHNELVTRKVTQKDLNAALAAHNAARKAVGNAPLKIDQKLMQSAQAYAQELVKKGKLEHSQSGENLFMSSKEGTKDLLDATNAWVDEKKDYKGEALPGPNFKKIGHFSKCHMHYNWRRKVAN